MKTLLLISLLLLAIQNSNAQNLVENGSFEDYILCPDNSNQVNRAIGWEGWCASPDYLNSCTSDTWISVPQNIYGTQSAASGNAYCGFYTYWEPVPPDNINVREHIGQNLITPLVIGKSYFVSIKVSLAPVQSYCACGKIGIKFTNSSYASYWGQATSPLVNNTAQIYADVPIIDTMNWVTVSGSFIADSAYQYIVIGNFFDDNQTNIIDMGTGCADSYYYIDDVVLLEDTTTSTVQINNGRQDISVYKVLRQVFIQSEFQQSANIEMYNALGQCINQFMIAPMENVTIDLTNYNMGYYYIRITTDAIITKTIFLDN